jgi:hypothetical protein
MHHTLTHIGRPHRSGFGRGGRSHPGLGLADRPRLRPTGVGAGGRPGLGLAGRPGLGWRLPRLPAPSSRRQARPAGCQPDLASASMVTAVRSRCTGHHELHRRRQCLQIHSVGNRSNQQRPGQRRPDRASASEQARPTDHRGGDGVEEHVPAAERAAPLPSALSKPTTSGTRTTSTSPGKISRSTPERACTAPNRLVMLPSSRIGVRRAALRGVEAQLPT